MNLKGLDQFVKAKHFKMEVFPDLIKAGNWIVKMDLKDACLQVQFHSAQ